MYPQVSYTPNILPDVHVINFTKKEQAVNSLDSKNTKKLIPFMNISNTSRLKSLQNEQASE